MQRRPYSPGFLIYAYGIGLLGFALLVWLTPGAGPIPSLSLLAFLFVMEAVADVFFLPLAKRFSLSLRTCFDYAAVIFLGPVWAAWVNGTSVILISLNLLRRRRNLSPLQMAGVLGANSAGSILTTLAGGYVYLAFGGQVPFGQLSTAVILPLLALFLATEAITAGLVGVVAFLTGQKRGESLYTLTRGLMVSFSAIPVAVSAALIFHEFRLPGLLVGAVPFVFAVVLFQRLGKARESLRQRVTELEILNQVGQAISSALDLDRLVELIYVETAKVLDVRNFHIALYDEDKNRISVVLDMDEGKRSPPQELPLEGGFIGWILENRKPLFVKNFAEEKARLPAVPLEPSRVGSYLGVPLLSGERAVGMIGIFSKQPNAFNEGHLQLLQTIAGQAAVAVENARLFETARREAEELKLLYEIGTTISSSLDLKQVLELMIDSIRKVVPYDAAGFFLIKRGTNEIESRVERGYPPGVHDLVGLKVGKGLLGTSAKEGKPIIVSDVARDPRYIMARPGTRSEVIVPLVSKGEVIGVFNLECDRLCAFGQTEVELLSSFASQAAIAIENARLYQEVREKKRLEEQLAVARDIQLSFLPKQDPEIPGFQIAGAALPSERVGGDYYDYISIADGQLGLVIGDVSGKGMPAALIMASFRASLIAEIRNNYSIATILSKVNALLFESTEAASFVTSVYGVLDTQKRILTYSNAGHNYPLWVRATGGIRALETGGTVLGAFPDSAYEQERLDLVPGDVLVFYTDGVTDARNGDQEMFGEERLLDLVQRERGRSAGEIRQAVLTAVNAFVHGAPQFDDITLLVVRAL